MVVENRDEATLEASDGVFYRSPNKKQENNERRGDSVLQENQRYGICYSEVCVESTLAHTRNPVWNSKSVAPLAYQVLFEPGIGRFS